VSSTASNVSATPAVASSPWPQTPAATQNNSQDNSSGPFAALVDAAATAPDTANTQPTPQPSAPRGSTAADQPAAKFSTRRTNGATGAAQSVTPDAQAPADPTKNANAAATPVASSNATVNPSAAQNTSADPVGAAAPADTASGTALDALAGAAATVVTDATANAATPDAKTKTSSDNGDHDESGSATDAGAATATAATNVQTQPVAAAVVANAVINTPPAATAGAAPDTVIGGSATASATPALPFADAKTIASSQNTSNAAVASDANTVPTTQDVKDAALTQDVKISAAGQDTQAAAPAQDARIAVAAQDAKITTPTAKAATPAQGAKATVSGKQTPSTGSSAPAANSSNADAASPADATDGQTWNGSAVPQGQARADSDTIITSQSGGSAATRIDALASTPASDAGGSPAAQSGWNAAKATTEGLPNFGIVANQTAPTAAAAAPGIAAAATVPIAGLAVAIASRAQAGSSQFDIRLDPPELGRIDVRLDVGRDGQVTSHVTVDRADTLQLLQNQQPQLERALEQAGLKTADNGLQFTLRDQSFAGQNGGSGGGAQPSPAQLVIPDADQPVIQATQIYSRAGLGSGVDIRV
jgi:flagellar hook-length control protein FliK